jgi:hypothetical protein
MLIGKVHASASMRWLRFFFEPSQSSAPFAAIADAGGCR